MGGYAVTVILSGIGTFLLIKNTIFELNFHKVGYEYIIAAGFVLVILYEKNNCVKNLFYWGVLINIFASVMTHGKTEYMYALPAIIAYSIMIIKLKGIFKYIGYLLIIGLLAFEFFMSNIILVSNTVAYGETIYNQKLEIIEEGPAGGIWARTVDVDKYKEIYEWIQANINQTTKVCYFGRNVLLYLMSPQIEIVVPQLFMDYSSDQVIVDYYENNPNQVPDLIIEDISPSSKRQISENEMQIVDGYFIVYESQNYRIYER